MQLKIAQNILSPSFNGKILEETENSEESSIFSNIPKKPGLPNISRILNILNIEVSVFRDGAVPPLGT